MGCSPPGSSVHRILQARILEWVAMSFSRGSSPPRDRSWVSCIAGVFTVWATREEAGATDTKQEFHNYFTWTIAFMGVATQCSGRSYHKGTFIQLGRLGILLRLWGGVMWRMRVWSKIQTADPAAGVGLLLPTLTLHLWITHLQASFRGEINFSLISASVVLNFLSLFSSVQFSHSVVSDSLQPRPPCPSPTPGVHSNSCPSSRWCHPAISSSVVPFSSCPQSLSVSESIPMSQLFAWGGQSTGVSALASFLPKKSQGWSPLEWLQGYAFWKLFSTPRLK